VKILFVHQDTCLYGASQSLLALIEGLRDRGHACSVLLPDRGPLARELEAREIAHDVVGWHGWTSSERQWWPRRMVSGFRRCHLNRRVVATTAGRWTGNPPDLIHTNSSKTPFGALLAQRIGVPHTWHFREFLGGEHTCGLVPALGKPLHRLVMKRISSAIVYVSRVLREYYLGWLEGIPSFVVYNGALRREEIRQHRPLPGEETLTLALVGRLYSLKEPFVAVEAVRRLRDDGLRVRLLIAGSGEEDYVRDLRQWLQRYDLAEQVEMLGRVGDIRTVYARSHAAVVCSASEACPRMVIEAMAQGRPVIGADAAGTAELVQHEVDGLLFRAGDSEDLARKIRHLAQHRRDLCFLGENAAAKAEREFTVEKYAQSMEQIFAQCLG
jgi:glycosyltransferase involved in cell wall biosynthesis